MKNKFLFVILAFSMLLVACDSESATPTTTEVTSESTTEIVTEATTENATEATSDAVSSPSTDAKTSASIMPEELIASYTPNGFSDGDAKKALFVVADPRKYSVNYDLINTAMAYFEAEGVEVEVRDLYDLNFNPVVAAEEFYYAKDGNGTPSPEIQI